MKPTQKRLSILILMIAAIISGCRPQIPDPFTDQARIRSEETSNSADMDSALEKILEWHQSNQTGIAKALNPGKDRATIIEQVAEIGCQPTEELLQLWTWHDGTTAVYAPFIWYHNFLSVEEALSEYQWLMKTNIIGWQNHWIPIFEFDGEWYFVECYP